MPGRVGRIYQPDDEGGVFHIEEGELCHTPMLADGRIEWGHSTAVDFFSLDEEARGIAQAAGVLLCRRHGYSPALTREILEGSEG